MRQAVCQRAALSTGRSLEVSAAAPASVVKLALEGRSLELQSELASQLSRPDCEPSGAGQSDLGVSQSGLAWPLSAYQMEMTERNEYRVAEIEFQLLARSLPLQLAALSADLSARQCGYFLPLSAKPEPSPGLTLGHNGAA